MGWGKPLFSQRSEIGSYHPWGKAVDENGKVVIKGPLQLEVDCEGKDRKDIDVYVGELVDVLNRHFRLLHVSAVVRKMKETSTT